MINMILVTFYGPDLTKHIISERDLSQWYTDNIHSVSSGTKPRFYKIEKEIYPEFEVRVNVSI